jgi:pimeloyl-ACP methyl ester carboxylesterase
MAPAPATDHLQWCQTTVDGRVASYGVAGDGLPVVFLHGWALGQHAYRRALKRLVRLGCQVFAPALPGFGGTAGLPDTEFSFAGYARWVDGFLGAVGVEGPVMCIGHSFGGGVAIALAHDFPRRVRSLVLVNSVGGSTWTAGRTVRSMAERPLWDWGLHFPGDVLPLPQVTRVLPVILQEAVPNVVRNPGAVWKVAQLARRADLTPELEDIRALRIPVAVVWGDKDQIIPRASFEALCHAVGAEGAVVAGNHSWLLADPDAFGAAMTDSVEMAKVVWKLEQRQARRRRFLRRPWVPIRVPSLRRDEAS